MTTKPRASRAAAAFDDCAHADLHLAEQIQSFGALVVIDKRSQCICACSANVEAYNGMGAAALLGQPYSMLFSDAQVPALFSPVGEPGSELPQLQQTLLGARPVQLAQHSLDVLTLVEIERGEIAPTPSSAFEKAEYLRGLAASPTAEAAAKVLMRHVASITRLDRVMLYKFLPDWHGEVIAESLQPGVPGYLGLRFPSTDVPANARRLYLRNGQRLIVDPAAEAVPLLKAAGCPPVDLTFCNLRAVHPVHIQYLRNLGVHASFSVSIVVAGQLRGLIACHHLVPHNVPLLQRQLCEELARIGSIHMSDMDAMQTERARSDYREARAEVRGALRAGDVVKGAIATQLTPIRKMFAAQGIWAHLDGHDSHAGEIPDALSLSILRNWLEGSSRTEIVASHRIPASLANTRPLVRFASGMLFMPLVDQDFLLLMRPEQIERVSWAGKPQFLEGGAELDRGLALTPRSSFKRWAQAVEGVSEPWLDVDLEAATKLREMLVEHIERVRLEKLALYDPLTGLANRHLFDRKLQEAIGLSMRDAELAAVYMLDLDRFKAVNDSLGHAAGDELLIEVSKRLKVLVRDRDVVARLGGDEFAIIQFHLARVEDADIIAARILQEIRRPFRIQGHDVEVGVSIGVAFCPFHSAEESELLQGADLALYQAKQGGRNAFKVFSNDMLSAREQKESVRIALDHALEHGGFSFVYQPIVAARTRDLHAFEAFARWQHPERGELRATEFVPLIVQYQLAVRFAEWGIRQAVQQAKAWQREGLALVPVSLNITTRQFLSLDIVGLCSALAREFDIGLEWLRFDLEDTAFLTDFQRTTEKITALAAVGVLTNIDHFGQAAIALERILGLRIHQLKVPGRLFDRSDGKRHNDALLAVIQSIGKVIRVPVVATQIESPAMVDHAVNAGIELLQGYAISACLTPAEAALMLHGALGHRGAQHRRPTGRT